MATKHLLDRNPDPTDDEIRESLDGNLCRCTGYTNIVKSVRAAAAALAEAPESLRTTGA
jgi:carbon-monoxide dehydrogenase small subunit